MSWDIRIDAGECRARDIGKCGNHRLRGQYGIPVIPCTKDICPLAIQYDRFLEWMEKDILEHALYYHNQDEVNTDVIKEIAKEKVDSLIKHLSKDQSKWNIGG